MRHLRNRRSSKSTIPRSGLQPPSVRVYYDERGSLLFRWWMVGSDTRLEVVHKWSLNVLYFGPFPAWGGGPEYTPDMEEFMSSFLRKPSEDAGQPRSNKGWSDKSFQKDYPALWEYLTSEAWDNGQPRETSTLLVFASEGRWKACLHDRALSAHLWAEGGSWDDLLACLEERLSDPKAAWREVRADQKTGKRK